MFNELDGHVFVERVIGRQLHGDLSHVLTEKCYPGSAVSLLEMAAGGQRRAAVEDTDIIQPQESALEEILAEPVFAVDPPTEIQHQLGKRSLEELKIALPLQRLFRPVQENGGPGMHRRIYVTKVPLVGRNLTGRMDEKLLQHQI